MSPADRSEQIVRVAAEHFARDGIAGASMRAIATDAGVTRALVYHYFPGKEALLNAVLRRESDLLLEATRPDPALSARANLRRALGAYLEFFEASRGGVRELYSPASTVPAVSELAEANHGVHVRWLLGYTEAQDSPRARLALGGWLAFVEYTARQSVDGGNVARADVVDLCISTLEGALGTSLTDLQPINQKASSE
ncbi:TetR family transcriptional regulator [Agromyces sp. MMS17-SY077]|uniref:TetR family transcriptional regulator n=2 Tax=Agromyces seonyuensis TaxID=2662446 RepID=A0A6I4P3D0_9MICO|nr:TetR/AcrR family transcriptional regulator [Agromyces seonyuensis]MWB99325.1 TetR family transcriptional regulator [Agromyces seonyuensis]